MKDNKKILSEISRIHEIMGISKPLLNESIWEDLFKLGAKNADEAIVIGGKAVPDELSVAIRNASKQVDDGVKSVKNSLDDVLKVARASAPELVDDLIERIVNHPSIVDTYISMADGAAKSVRKLVDEGKSLTDALKQVDEDIYGPMFRESETLPDEIYRRFWNDVTKEVGDYKPKTKPDGGTPKPDGGTPKPDGGTPNEKVTKEIEGWDEWDKIPNYKLSEINELLEYNRFAKWLKDVFTSQETILLNSVKRFNKLSKAYADAVKKGVSTKVQATLENEMVKELQVIVESGLNQRKQAEIWIRNTVEGFEKTSKGQIIDPSEKRFAEWVKRVTNSDGTLKNPSEIRKINIQEKVTSDLVVGFKEAFSWIKSLPDLFKRFTKKQSPSAEVPSNNVGSTARRFVVGSRRGSPWRDYNKKRWDDVIDAKGLTSAKRQYLYELLFRYIQWNLIWGLAVTVYQSAVAATTNKETRAKIDGCITSRALPDSDTTKKDKIQKYCESIKTMKEIQLLHYLEDDITVVLFKNMIYDWDDTSGFSGFSGLIDLLTDLFPGKLDDFILDFIIPYFVGTRDAETVEEWQEQWGNVAETASEEVSTSEEDVNTFIEENNLNLSTGEETTTDDEDSTPESSSDNNTPQPSSIEDVASKLGRPTNEVTQDGDIFIWTFNGQEMGRYKLINGELERQ